MKKIEENFKYVILGVLVLFTIISVLITNGASAKENDSIIKENNQSNEKKYYYVDIKGEVKDPGVYKLKEGSRVIDAINASGGLKENANTYSVNLSKKITDEMVIIVPSNSENTNVSNNTITQNTKNSSLVNINTATTKELLSITGIGESKASNIVKYREENGNFSSIEDIKNVSGIGDSLFEKINVYKGKYHVLGGLISPLEGIGPEDININKLISRIDGDKVNEIILALKPSIEGETTMQYIKKLLENKNVKVTRIATGIPIGTDIEYIDPMTLEFALEGRKDI